MLWRWQRFVQLEGVTSSDPGLSKAEKPFLHMHGVMGDLVDNYRVASNFKVGGRLMMVGQADKVSENRVSDITPYSGTIFVALRLRCTLSANL